MSLSENIKNYRLKKNMTQEQLASLLGVSSQAVSKWECSDSYPDGSLYVPLADALGVSLDRLFGRNEVYMDDIASRIIRLYKSTPKEKHFEISRILGWQIEKGLFGYYLSADDNFFDFDPDDISGDVKSYILNDYGFTAIANDSQFFSVFEEPDDGWSSIIGDGEEMRRIFECLSKKATMDALIWLYHQSWDYLFEAELVGAVCRLNENELTCAMTDLETLGLIQKREINIDNTSKTLYYARQKHMIIALFLFAHELNHRVGYNMQYHPLDRIYLK